VRGKRHAPASQHCGLQRDLGGVARDPSAAGSYWPAGDGVEDVAACESSSRYACSMAKSRTGRMRMQRRVVGLPWRRG